MPGPGVVYRGSVAACPGGGALRVRKRSQSSGLPRNPKPFAVAVGVLILVLVAQRGDPETEADLRFQLRRDDDDMLTGHLH